MTHGNTIHLVTTLINRVANFMHGYKFILRHYLLFLFLLLVTTRCFALEQHAQLWAGLNYEKPLNQQWTYLLYTQSRFINESHPWDSTLFEGGLGYLLTKDKVVWFGYRWTAQNPNNGFFQENRLWQQLQWNLSDNKQHIILSRTRLEQIERTNQSQILWRLRERIMYKYNIPLHGNIIPVAYDEIFLQVHKTNYSSNKFFSQNRLFIGFDLYLSRQVLWELGYMNQFIFNVGTNNQNVMNHIISATYNIG